MKSGSVLGVGGVVAFDYVFRGSRFCFYPTKGLTKGLLLEVECIGRKASFLRVTLQL